MPKLSIIVTCYNIEDYVTKCLDSIVGQTFQDIEIIVVDDGSTDTTPKIIKTYAEKDPRIVPVLEPENTPGGVATAANKGLDLACGDYVGFADGDDIYFPKMFETLLDAAANGSHDLAICKYQLLNDKTGDRLEPAEFARWDGLDASSILLTPETRKQFLQFIAVPWRKLYKRSFLENHKIRYPVGDYFFEDNPFHWAVLSRAKSIALVPEILCLHRIARGGQTMATADERLFRIFQHHETIRKDLETLKIEPEYRSLLLSWVMSQTVWIARQTPKELNLQLFEVLAPIFATYTEEDVTSALRIGNKGLEAMMLSTALLKQDFELFERHLQGRPKGTSIFADAIYHMRHSGVRHTAKLVKRFVLERLLPRIGQSLRATFGQSPTKVQNEDLMVAMIALQKQMSDIEARLDTQKKDEMDAQS